MRIAGVPEHFNLPLKLALSDDAFKHTGSEVAFFEYGGGTGAMTAALSNAEVDAALLLTEGAVLDILMGGNHHVVKVYVESPLIWGIHVAADSPLQDPTDGHRVAISRYGSGSHLIAMLDAAERGVDAKALNFVVVDDLSGARKALANGDADVFLWERYTTQPLVDAGEFRRIGQRFVPWPAFVVSVRHAFLDGNEAQVRAVFDIIGDYAERLKADERAARLISKVYGMTPTDAGAWLEEVRWCPDYARPDTALQRVHTALRTQGVIDTDALDITAVWRSL